MTEPAKPLACPFCGGEVERNYAGSSDWSFDCVSPTCGISVWVSVKGVDETAKATELFNTRAADPRLAELRAIADQLRTDLELLTLAETQGRSSIIDLDEWKARNPNE
jgi:hypothetical protein